MQGSLVWSEESLQFVPSSLLAIRQGEALCNFDVRVGSHMCSGFLGPAVGLQTRSSKEGRRKGVIHRTFQWILFHLFWSETTLYQCLWSSIFLRLRWRWLHLLGRCQCNAHGCFAIPNVNHSILCLVKHWGHVLWLFFLPINNMRSYIHRLHICISLQRLAAIKLTASGIQRKSKANSKHVPASTPHKVLGSLLGQLHLSATARNSGLRPQAATWQRTTDASASDFGSFHGSRVGMVQG